MNQLLDRRPVSRKTRGDGKHEIGEAAAARLETLGTPFQVLVNGAPATGSVVAMPCGCARGATGHVHHFLESDALRPLPEGADAELVLRADGVVEVRTP